jgi:bacillolysin
VNRVTTWIGAATLASAMWVTASAVPQGQQAAAGAMRVAATDPGQIRQWDSRLDRMIRDRELEVTPDAPDTLVPGRTHERLQQYYRGVPVVGADVRRQMDQGLTVSVFGQVYSGIDLDPTPGLSADEARAIVEQRAGARLPASRVPRLTVLPKDDGGFALAYEAEVFAHGDLRHCFVDATTGDTLLEYSNLKTQEAAVGTGHGVLGDIKKMSATARGTQYMAEDGLRPPRLVTYDARGSQDRADALHDGDVAPAMSDEASDADNDWTDGVAVDAHTYLAWTYDYYFKRFGRRGLDDRSAPILGLIHPVRRQDVAFADSSNIKYFLNASWCGGCTADGNGIMMFGEGLPSGWYLVSSGQYVDYYAASLDIVAHELTHGVTDHTSQLDYRDESGALNEAFSDIMGISVKWFFQPMAPSVLKANYLLGDNTYRPYRPGSLAGIRSLADPAAYGHPDHYSKRYLGTSDNGGVHTNSGIANHAFYLAIEGGTNRTSGLAVQGVGSANREQIEKIFYRAFTQLLPSNATFAVARAATIQAAQDLYGAGSAPERAMTQAWTAVGVQ